MDVASSTALLTLAVNELGDQITGVLPILFPVVIGFGIFFLGWLWIRRFIRTK